MARDDYYVIVGKILVYLYARLKGKAKAELLDYIHPMSEDFPISDDYLGFVLDEMLRHGYIRMHITKGWGGKTVYRELESIQITQEGIDFLQDNFKVHKVLKAIPMAASIAELFQ